MKSSEKKEQEMLRQIEDLKQQITDLEMALSESENNFRNITDVAPVGIFLNDSQGRATYINKKCAELIGVPADQALNFDWIPYLHPDDRDQMVAEWDKAYKSRTKFYMEYRWVHQDGKIVWVLGEVVPVLDEDEKTTMFIGTLTDITKRKNFEIALSESEEKFRALADNSPLAIYASTGNQQVGEYINPTFVKMFGYTLDEVPSANEWWPLAYPEQEYRNAISEEAQKRIDHAITKGSAIEPMETIVTCKDGSKKNILWFYTSEGKQNCSIGLDLTEIRKTEEELLKSQKLLRDMGKIGKVGGWEVNIDSGQQEWTKEVYHIHEVDMSFNPSIDAGINFYSEESRPIISEAFKRAVEHGEPYNVNLDIITAKGNLRHVHAIGIPDLERRRIYGFFQDITDKKQAENERENLILELQKKTAEQERFIYTVSHDLKSPLVNISGFSDLAEQDLNSGDQVSAKNDLAIIKQSALRMRRLLDELLEISRIGIKKNPEEVVNLNTLIDEALFNLSGLIKGLHTTIEVESDLPDVRLDKPRFLQVFENLITNASRYSRSASGGSHVKVGVIRNDDELICYVKDNGIGIESHYLEKIFGLFERLDPNTDGTGVGLAIVKRIIENHGGRIWAESEGLGQGATFFFALPEAKS